MAGCINRWAAALQVLLLALAKTPAAHMVGYRPSSTSEHPDLAFVPINLSDTASHLVT